MSKKGTKIGTFFFFCVLKSKMGKLSCVKSGFWLKLEKSLEIFTCGTKKWGWRGRRNLLKDKWRLIRVGFMSENMPVGGEV